MAKLQKKYIRQAQKKVPSKQWKKRGLKTAWRLQKAAKRGRTSSPKKRNRNTRPKTNRRKRTMSKMKIPHPSVTGMAAGLNIVNYLNDAGGSYTGDSVLKNLQAGDYFQALNRFRHTAAALVKWPSGKKALGESIGIAVIGAGVRKLAGNPKLGGTKLYFRV
jgi:hypothetical protein